MHWIAGHMLFNEAHVNIFLRADRAGDADDIIAVPWQVEFGIALFAASRDLGVNRHMTRRRSTDLVEAAMCHVLLSFGRA